MLAEVLERNPEARTWGVKIAVAKWASEEAYDAGELPDEVVNARHNLLLNAGITRLLNLLTGAGGQAYDTTHARIGVGDDSTAASASQTDLQAGAGSTHRQFKLVDATYPLVSGQTVTLRVTAASGEANFAWQEWGIDPGTADSTTVTSPMLNRKVASLGTKVAGSVWQFTATITIS